jgi:fructose-bisphosphate aldolase class II
VLKIDGEVGNKKVYDPRGYLKKAEKNMADRLIQATEDLCSTGKTICGTV